MAAANYGDSHLSKMYNGNMKSKILNVMIILLLISFFIGCGLFNGIEDEDKDEDDLPIIDDGKKIYFYIADEFTGGLFGALKPDATVNEWCLKVLYPPQNYDSWSQSNQLFLYKDEELEMAFIGEDIINKDTVFYSDFPFAGKGEKVGEISGAITLTGIPQPLPVVHLQNYGFAEGKWWFLNRRIDMSEFSGTTTGTFNWTLPAYDNFVPNQSSAFRLSVLPADSLTAYEVSVSNKNISGVNANVGSLGTINISSTTLSGTITFSGQSIHRFELYARDDGNATLGSVILYNPINNAPWSMTFKSLNANFSVTFIVYIYNPSNDLPLEKNFSSRVTNYQSINDIVLDLGEIQ